MADRETVRDVIFNRECVPMRELSDNSIDLVISGPPYWSRFDYAAFADGRPHMWQTQQSYVSYLDELVRWHTECHRVLRPGRFCAIVLGSVERDGKTYHIPFDALSVIRDIGFEFVDEIIWNKISGGRQAARNFLKLPVVRKFRPNIRTEYILVFRKAGPDLQQLNGFDWADQVMLDRDFFVREVANNIWNIPVGRGRKEAVHPCPFPLELPARLIELYSAEGETVLDPFMGIGSTAIAARRLGRHFVGYEKEARFCSYAERRIACEPRSPGRWRSRMVVGYEKW